MNTQQRATAFAGAPALALTACDVVPTGPADIAPSFSLAPGVTLSLSSTTLAPGDTFTAEIAWTGGDWVCGVLAQYTAAEGWELLTATRGTGRGSPLTLELTEPSGFTPGPGLVRFSAIKIPGSRNCQRWLPFVQPGDSTLPQAPASFHFPTVAVTKVGLNQPPVADAGADQTVFVGDAAMLDGRASSDPDAGDVLSYAWSISAVPPGSVATLAGANTATPSLTPDQPGDYTVELVVNDGTVDSPLNPVTVTAETAGSATERILSELRLLVAQAPGAPWASKLSDAIAKAEVALEELAKDPPDDQAAAGNLEGSVGEVEAAQGEGLDAAVGASIMDGLARAVRHLAITAIEDAVGRGGNSDKIATARDSLAEGEALRASGAFKDAVNKYKDAISNAEGA